MLCANLIINFSFYTKSFFRCGVLLLTYFRQLFYCFTIKKHRGWFDETGLKNLIFYEKNLFSNLVGYDDHPQLFGITTVITFISTILF